MAGRVCVGDTLSAKIEHLLNEYHADLENSETDNRHQENSQERAPRNVAGGQLQQFFNALLSVAMATEFAGCIILSFHDQLAGQIELDHCAYPAR